MYYVYYEQISAETVVPDSQIITVITQLVNHTIKSIQDKQNKTRDGTKPIAKIMIILWNPYAAPNV